MKLRDRNVNTMGDEVLATDRTDDGRLVTIDTKDASVTGWPWWGGDTQRTGVAR